MKYLTRIFVHYVGDTKIRDYEQNVSDIVNHFYDEIKKIYSIEIYQNLGENNELNFVSNEIIDRSFYEQCMNKFDLTIEVLITRIHNRYPPYKYSNYNFDKKFYLGKHAELFAILEINANSLTPDNYSIIQKIMKDIDEDYEKKKKEIHNEYIEKQKEINNKIKELLQEQYDIKLKKISRVKRAL